MAPSPDVVAAVVVRNGRAFVIRRAADRRLFPGCWDLPGGHVEPGEAPAAALAREVAEETGWRVVGVLGEVLRHEWTGSDGVHRTEVDYLVAVDGDLDSPRLELAKHPEFRWIGVLDLPLLSEGRQRHDDAIARAVARALELDAGGLGTS